MVRAAIGGAFIKPDTKVSGFFVDYFGEKFIPNLFREAQVRELKTSRKTSFFCLSLVMSYYVYILFSKKVNSYYMLETSDLINRLNWRNAGEFKKAHTKIDDDW